MAGFAVAQSLNTKPESSIADLEAAARRTPNDERIQFDLGLALVKAGRLKEAIAPLQKASADKALADETHFLLGVNYFELQQYTDAIDELQRSPASNHPDETLYLMEESERRTGRLQQAKETFHELLTRYPDSAWTHYLMGAAYEQQQDLDKALEEYQAAFQRDSSLPNVKFAIGYLYWRRQDTGHAREWLQKEAAAGCHALAEYYLGEMAREERNYPVAESLYKRSIQCDPSNANAHMRLGVVLGDEKHLQEATAQLREAIRLNPSEPSAHYRLAVIYRRLGQNDKAEAEYQTVHELQSHSQTLGTMGDRN